MNLDIIHDKLSIVGKIHFQLLIQRNRETFFQNLCHLNSYGVMAC
jgi:hypothetical protein